jgi:hypothetical protein
MTSQQNIAQLQTMQTVTAGGIAVSLVATLQVRVLCREGQRVLIPW